MKKRLQFIFPLMILAVLFISTEITNAQSFEELWSVSHEDEEWLSEFAANRSIAYSDGKIYMTHRQGITPDIYIIDAANGELIGSISTGIETDPPQLDAVTVSDDGFIFASNHTNDAGNVPLRVFVWFFDGDTEPVEIITEYIEDETKVQNIGMYLNVSGSVEDGSAVLYAPWSNDLHTYRWTVERDGLGYNVQEAGQTEGAVSDFSEFAQDFIGNWGRPPYVAPMGPGLDYGYLVGGRASNMLRSISSNPDEVESTGYFYIPDVGDDEDLSGPTAVSYQRTASGSEYIFAYHPKQRSVWLYGLGPEGDADTDRTGSDLAMSEQMGINTQNIFGDMAVVDNQDGSFNVYVLAPQNGIWAYEITIEDTPPNSTENNGDVAWSLELSQNYPNPFNPMTVIGYSVSDFGPVTLTVYDMLGREVAELVNESHSPGSYEVSLDASHLSSGNYIYRLEAGGQSLARRMTVVK